MYFVAGIAMYLMYRYGPSLLLWGIVGTSWALALHHVAEWVRIRSEQTEGAVIWRNTAAIITVIFLVMLLVALGKLSWIRGRWLTVAGALTYPLYLIHWEAGNVIFAKLEPVLPSPWLRLAVIVVAVLVTAWLLYRLVERPLQPILRRRLARSFAEIRERSAAEDASGGNPAKPPAPAAALPPAEARAGRGAGDAAGPTPA